MMTLRTIAACTVGLSFLLMTVQWSSGYFVRLAPFSIFTPFVMLGALAALAALTLGAAVFLCFGKRRFRERGVYAGVILVAASLPFWTALQLVGFEFRVRQMTAAQWQRLADDMRQARSVTEDEGPNQRGRDRWNQRIAAQLAATHPVLALGDFPPKLFISEEQVGVYWGSGLTGTLAVEVSVEPSVGNLSGDSRRRQIYDRVVMVWD